MKKQIHYSAKQRLKGLSEFLEDGKKYKFSSVVMKKYRNQLKEVQAEIQRDKNKLEVKEK